MTLEYNRIMRINTHGKAVFVWVVHQSHAYRAQNLIVVQDMRLDVREELIRCWNTEEDSETPADPHSTPAPQRS